MIQSLTIRNKTLITINSNLIEIETLRENFKISIDDILHLHNLLLYKSLIILV